MNDLEVFKWRVLSDLAFEDHEGMWEPLWGLRGCYAIEGQSESERQAFAERAMRELHDDGLIYFFRAAIDINAAADGPDARLGDAQVERELASAWWRTPLGSSLPDDHPNIWIATTAKGDIAAQDPPDEIRRRFADDPR
jgi:hypothetical protein